MNNSQSNSEFVETAFTAEEEGVPASTGATGDDGGACAFLEELEQPPQQCGAVLLS